MAAAMEVFGVVAEVEVGATVESWHIYFVHVWVRLVKRELCMQSYD